MPEKPAEPNETPDVRRIRQLVRLMQRYDLTAIDLIEGQSQIRLRRRRETASSASAPVAWPPSPGQSPPSPPAEPAPQAPVAAAGVFIESPMVGTFYAAGAPDAPPFVSVGSPVRADTTVGIIEAMKVFTEIPANIVGTITEILVKDKQPVEFGQPLFRVEPA